MASNFKSRRSSPDLDVVDVGALLNASRNEQWVSQKGRRARQREKRAQLLKTSLLAPLLAAQGCNTLTQDDLVLDSSAGLPLGADDGASLGPSAPGLSNAITAGADDFTQDSGETLTINVEQLLANDTQVNNENLEVVRVFDADNGSVFFDGQVIEFVAEEGFSGEAQFVYEVRDADGNLQQGVVSIDVGDGNGEETSMHMESEDSMHEMGDGHGDDSGTHFHPDDPAKATEHTAALSLAPVAEATHIAVNSGSWFDPNTWANGEVPGEGAQVVISHGTTVIYDEEADASIFTVRVDGELEFSTTQDTFLEVDTLLVSPSGSLTIGTEDNPIPPDVNAVIQIADNGPIDVEWDPLLLSRGVVSHGAVEIHGTEKASHLKVDVDPLAGDSSLTLSEAPEGWQIGDTLVLHGTHLQPVTRDSDGALTEDNFQDEILTITSIDGNVINFEPQLQYDHDAPRDDLKPFVANFSRNVTIQTENADELPPSQRGHVIFMHSDDVDVRYAAFDELGRTDKSVRAFDVADVDPVEADSNIQGRYALHVHRAGVSDLDEPATLIGNTVWGSPGWGIVQHDSNALINNNAVYDAFGAAFVAETGNETGRWANNISIRNEGADVTPKDGPDTHAFDLGRNGVGFWFQGRLVEAVGNVAASAPSGNGFVYNSRGQDFGVIDVDPSTYSLSDALRYQSSAETYEPPIQSFYGNTAIGVEEGLYITKPGPNQGHDIRSRIEGFYAWEVRNGAYLEYTAHYNLVDFDLVAARDPDVARENYGIRLWTNAYDIITDGGTIDGFETGVRLDKLLLFDLPNNDFEFTFIDVDIRNSIESDFFGLDSGDRLLTRDDLIDRDLTFISDNQPGEVTLDLDNRTAVLAGDRFDSLGASEVGDGFDVAEYGFDRLGNIIREEGWWTLPDGRQVTIIEQYVSDRVTGELLKVANVIEINDTNGSFFLETLGAPLENFYRGELDLNNRGPNGVDDVFSATAGQTATLNVLANDFDPEGDALSVDGFQAPLHGLLTVNDNGTFNYRADDGFEGQDSFTYFLEDDQANITSVDVVINVEI